MGIHLASLHSIAIEPLSARQTEKLQTKGLGQFLRKLNDQFEMGLESFDYPRRIPDAWAYEPYETDECPGTLYLFEIEDSHALTADKLWEYANAADTFDFYSLDTRLFVYDRYCEQEREINLRDYYWRFLVADAKART